MTPSYFLPFGRSFACVSAEAATCLTAFELPESFRSFDAADATFELVFSFFAIDVSPVIGPRRAGVDSTHSNGLQQRQRARLIQPALTPAHNAGGLAVRLGNDVSAQTNKHDEIS